MQPTRAYAKIFHFCFLSDDDYVQDTLSRQVEWCPVQTHTVRFARFIVRGLGMTRHCPARKWSATLEIGITIEPHRFIAFRVCSYFEVMLERSKVKNMSGDSTDIDGLVKHRHHSRWLACHCVSQLHLLTQHERVLFHRTIFEPP